MSLINQMLRDLEQRTNTNSATRQPLNIQTPSHSPANKTGWLWLLVIVVAALIGIRLFDQNKLVIANPQTTEPTHQPGATLSPVEKLIARTSPQPEPPIAQTPAAPEPTRESSPAQPQQKPESAVTETPGTSKPSTKQLTQKVVATAHQKTENSGPKPRPSKKTAQTLYRQAQDSASMLMRKETLKEALEVDPEYLPARDLMLQTLLKSAPTHELEKFIHESLALFPNHLAFVTSLARLQLQRQELAAATATLEHIDSNQSNEPAFLSLLAASYQQQKRFQNAANIYQKLTQIQPEKAENWLGLGICAENIHQRQIAIQAYRQALAKKTLNTDVVDYINQRLTVLN